jgi:hypothetical protein
VTYATALAVEVVNGNPAELILVIAPTHREFDYWCRMNSVSPRAANIRFVTRDEDLRGYSSTWYVFLGVPDGRQGLALLDMFEQEKATGGLKDACVAREKP